MTKGSRQRKANPSTEEIRRLREENRLERIRRFRRDLVELEERHEVKLNPVAVAPPRELLPPFAPLPVGAALLLVPFEDFSGGRPPREQTEEENVKPKP